MGTMAAEPLKIGAAAGGKTATAFFMRSSPGPMARTPAGANSYPWARARRARSQPRMGWSAGSPVPPVYLIQTVLMLQNSRMPWYESSRP